MSSTILTLESSFGESGRDGAKFRLPRYVCALPPNNIIVSDAMNQRLAVLTTEGDFVRTLVGGEPGAKPGQLCGPSGCIVDGNYCYVAEAGNHRVQKVRLPPGSAGGEQQQLKQAAPDATGSPSEEPPPASVDAGATMSIAEGDAVATNKVAGQHGTKRATDLWCPQGVAIAKRFGSEVKELFVCDHVNGRVVCFDASSMEHVRTFGEKGSEPAQLLYPMGVAVEDQDVFVSELGNHRVSVFSKKGEFKRTVGAEGREPGQFHEPRGLAFVKGWLVVAESKRVSVLSPQGEPKQVLELPGSGLLWGCCRLADEKSLLVSDVRAGNAKIYVLNVCGEAYDDGSSPAERAAREASLKRAAEEEKLREWQASRASSKGA
jgi:hypothetical protein